LTDIKGALGDRILRAAVQSVANGCRHYACRHGVSPKRLQVYLRRVRLSLKPAAASFRLVPQGVETLPFVYRSDDLQTVDRYLNEWDDHIIKKTLKTSCKLKEIMLN